MSSWIFFPVTKLSEEIGQDMTRLFRCYVNNRYNAYATPTLSAFYVPEDNAEELWKDVEKLFAFAGFRTNTIFKKIDPSTWFAKAYANCTSISQWDEIRSVRFHILGMDPIPEEEEAYKRLSSH